MVVPGSHKRPIDDHHHPEERCFSGAVEPDNFDWGMGKDLIALEDPAGSVTFHHVRIMHGLALNRSEIRSRLLLLEYADADAWPIMGLGPPTLTQCWSFVCAGEPDEEPRQTNVTAHLPLPPAPQ